MQRNKSAFRIGIDATNLRGGGGHTHLIELIGAANPTRDKFDSLIVWGSDRTLELIADAPWLQKASVPKADSSIFRRLLWQRFGLSKAVRASRCDVLFVPGGSFYTTFRPVVTMSRNMLPFEWCELRRYGVSMMTLKLVVLRFAQAWSFRRAEGVIFLSNYAKQGVLSVVGPLRGDTRVIPHGLNSRFLASESELVRRKLLGIVTPIRLVYVSTVDLYKHQWNVVEAVAIARNSVGLDLQLNLIGSAYEPALRKLRAAIAKFDPHGDWVNYLGPIDYLKLSPIYANAHLGIFASTCENMPNTLLETMAAGLPVLSSDRGPMPEILTDSGLFFDPENPSSLADVLVGLLKSENKIQHFSSASHQIAKEFSWDRCARATFEFIGQAVDNYRRTWDAFNNFPK